MTKNEASNTLKALPNLEGIIRVIEPGTPPNFVFVAVVNGDHGKDMEVESYVRFKGLPPDLKKAIHATFGIKEEKHADVKELLEPLK
jgi:hypothetical protein